MVCPFQFSKEPPKYFSGQLYYFTLPPTLFTTFMKFSTIIIFLKIFFQSFLLLYFYSDDMNIKSSSVVFHRSLSFCSFFGLFFLFFRLSKFYRSVDLSLRLAILSSVISTLLLKPFRVFHFVYCIFQLHLFFFMTCIYLLMFQFLFLKIVIDC